MTGYKCVYAYLLIVLISTLWGSCSSQSKYPTPEGYDLNHPNIVKLESQLNEISGIVYYPKDTGVFAISDANGSLYKIFPDRHGQVEKWKFGNNHDYEDLQLVDSIFYVLASSGNIVSIKFMTKDSMQVSNFEFPDKRKNEFEILYYDSSLGKLILVCKDCKDDKKGSVSTWAFDIKDQTYGKGPYTIDVKEVEKRMHGKDLRFKPSAAAINPLTNELYIVSSVNKALVIADRKGAVKAVYLLSPGLYKQPEGIAFTPAGDLLISNEASDEGSPNILVIKYKKNVQ